MWERWKSELKSWEILCLVSTRGSGQEMGFVVREFSSHASQERSLDKNNEIISTLQASSSITDQFGGQFVQEFSPWSSSRIMHWISQKKKFTFRPGQNFSLVNTTNFYKSMLYKLFWLTIVRYWVSVIVFHYSLKQGHLFSDPFQQRLQISF